MKMIETELSIALPEWCSDFLNQNGTSLYHSDGEKMSLVTQLLDRHIYQKTGGPFAAAVFSKGGRLAAIGLNLVVPANNSTAHAEMVAIQLAQKSVGNYTLGDEDFSMATSAEPCAQCYGAIPWSGLKRIVVGVPGSVASSLGFDEGPKPTDWQEHLAKRGIMVTEGVNARAIESVMRKYQQSIYNG